MNETAISKRAATASKRAAATASKRAAASNTALDDMIFAFIASKQAAAKQAAAAKQSAASRRVVTPDSDDEPDSDDSVDEPDDVYADINCSSDVFKDIIAYAKNKPLIKNNVEEANILYNNGKFYYSSGEMVGALVSYSCATVLLNSILRAIPNAPENTTAIYAINKLMNSLLQVIQNLQQSVGSSKSDDDKDETKDWEKICTKIKPLVFKKGGADCIFYDDVAGLVKEKKLIDSSLVYPLVYPNLYPKTSKGILIYGPPGTGKTYLVKAAVNELQKKDDSVGVLFFSPSPGDLKGKYVGETEKRIEEAFRCASDAACKYQIDCPGKKKYISIIFMDEMDAIAPDRDKDTTGLAVNSVNTLLQMMDGIKSFPNVAVVAATNYPWNLDGAILRRFDTQILINIPSELDLKELLNISMNRFINLEADKSSFDYCASKGKKSDSDNDKQLNCELECERKPIVERYRNYPYSQYNIDYFNNIGEGGLVDSIVYSIAKDKFSNSDLDRLIKAAATNAGELAVEQSLFYSPRLIGDFKHDKYISALTSFKFLKTESGSTDIDHEKIAQTSIDVLKSFIDNKNPENIIQLKPPDFVRIEYDGYYYYNTKCLLCKNNDSLIQHYTIKDIYIKGNKTTDTNFSVTEYYKNILGREEKRRLIEGATSSDIYLGQARYEDEDYEYSYGEEYKFDAIDMVIAFDFTFKQNSNFSTEKTLLPIYRDLLDYVFQPIYDTFQDIKQNIELSQQIGKNLTDVSGNKSAVGQKYKPQVKGNAKKGGAELKELDTPKEGETQGDVLKRNMEHFLINKDNTPILEWSPATAAIVSDIDFKDNMMLKLNNKFSVSSIDEHNLDFYNHLLLYNILEKTTNVVLDQSNIENNIIEAIKNYFNLQTVVVQTDYYNKYVKLTNELLDQKKGEIMHKDLNKATVELYLSLINYKNKITFLQDTNVSSIPETELYSNIKKYTLLDGTTEPMFYYKIKPDDVYGIFRITVAQYKRFIKNFNVYNNIFLIKSTLEDQFIDIHEDLFEILFKDVFSDIKITASEDDLYKIWTPGSLKARLIQLYINDIIKLYDLYVSFLNTDIKNDIDIIKNVNKKNNLDAVLFGYLLVLYCLKSNIKDAVEIDAETIMLISLQVINDNFNIQKLHLTFLGAKMDVSGNTLNIDNKVAENMNNLLFFDIQNKPLTITELNKAKTDSNYKSGDPISDKLKSYILSSGERNEKGEVKSYKGGAGLDISEINKFGRVSSIAAVYLNAIEGGELPKGIDKTFWGDEDNDDEEEFFDTIEDNETEDNKLQDNETQDNETQDNETEDNKQKYDKDGNPVYDVDPSFYNSGGGSKSKTFKNKRVNKKSKSAFLKKKSKTFKNIKQHTHNNNRKMRIKFNKRGGADNEKAIDAFVKWCVINKDETGNADLAENGLGPIANKCIFIKTQFKQSEIKEQRKEGIFNNIWGAASKIGTSLSNLFKKQKKGSDESRYKEIIEGLRKNNQLLPIVFNAITALGFLDSSDKIKDDQLILSDKTTPEIGLKWININNWSVYCPSMFSLFKTGLGINSNVGWSAENWLGAVGLGAVVGTGTAPIIGLVGLTAIIAANIYTVWTQNPKKNPEDIINDVGTLCIFNLLTEIRYMECNNLDTTTVFVEFAKQIEKVSWTILSFTSKQGQLKQWKDDGKGEIVTIKKYSIGNNVITRDIKNKLVNLNIPMQSFYFALNIVKSTYNKETGPLLLEYFEDRDKFMESQKKREAKKK
jgi:SpoVK/Ycf46/Vps4 family AAA+-type ATPase